MDEPEKEFVRNYNAAVKHGDPLDKVTKPTGITVKARRTSVSEERVTRNDEEEPKKQPPKRRKGVTFGLKEEDQMNSDL
jgi:hypothetical protein